MMCLNSIKRDKNKEEGGGAIQEEGGGAIQEEGVANVKEQRSIVRHIM